MSDQSDTSSFNGDWETVNDSAHELEQEMEKLREEMDQMKMEVAKKDYENEQKNIAISEKNEELVEKNREIQKKDGKVKTLQEEKDAKSKENERLCWKIESMENELETLREKIETNKILMDQKYEEIVLRNMEIERKNRELLEMNRQIEKKERLVYTLLEIMEDQDKENEELRSNKETVENEMEKMREELKTTKMEMNTKDEEIVQKQIEITERDVQIEKKDGEIRDLREKEDVKDKKIKELSSKIANVSTDSLEEWMKKQIKSVEISSVKLKKWTISLYEKISETEVAKAQEPPTSADRKKKTKEIQKMEDLCGNLSKDVEKINNKYTAKIRGILYDLETSSMQALIKTTRKNSSIEDFMGEFTADNDEPMTNVTVNDTESHPLRTIIIRKATTEGFYEICWKTDDGQEFLETSLKADNFAREGCRYRIVGNILFRDYKQIINRIVLTDKGLTLGKKYSYIRH